MLTWVDPPYAIWSIWLYLPLLPKLVFLGLCAICIYSIYSAAITEARLREFANAPQGDEIGAIQQSLTALRKSCAKLHQIVGASFYLFGFVLFLGFQSAVVNIPETRTMTQVVSFTLDNFMLYFAFAENAFFVLIIIHLVQWFASARIDAHGSRLNSHPVE